MTAINGDQGKLPQWMLFLLGALMYLPTLQYGYVLDDKIVLSGNQITKKGLSHMFDHFFYDSMDGFWADQYGVDVEELGKKKLVSGGRYRPLTMVTHSLEYGIFGDNPWVGHLMNALLYGFCIMLLYQVILGLMGDDKKKWYLSAVWLAVALYAAHPLHVEVVANIKGRDEILSLMFGLLAWRSSLNTEDKNHIFKAALFFFLGLLAKESTIAFAAVIPASHYFFKSRSVREMLIMSAPYLGVGLAYVFIRMAVLGDVDTTPPDELMNNPFLWVEGNEKWATILLTIAAYLKLLVVPHPLTHDYYPFHLPFVEDAVYYPTLTHPAVLVAIILVVGFIYVFVKEWKSKGVHAFAIFFFAATSVLILNIFFPIGVFMNERFMFIPSVALVFVLVHWIRKKEEVTKVLQAVVLAFLVLTVLRLPAWESDKTLSLTDVEVSTGSSKAHMGAAQALLGDIKIEKDEVIKNELISECYEHLKLSLEIYPNYFPPVDLLGQLYFEAGNYDESLRMFVNCADRKPENPGFVTNIQAIGSRLLLDDKPAKAVVAFEEAITRKPNDASLLAYVAEVYGSRLNNLKRAEELLARAEKLRPNDVEVLQKQGIVRAQTARYPEALEYFTRALELSPDNPLILRNLGITYAKMGVMDKSDYYLNRATELQNAAQ